MSESNEPDWLAELAKSGEALRRQAEPIVQAAEQFVRDARQAKASGGGPALPFAQRLALAVDAGMRELLSPCPIAHQRTAALTVPVTFAVVAKVAASGGFALSPVVFVSDGDVATVTETGSVEVLDSPRGLARVRLAARAPRDAERFLRHVRVRPGHHLAHPRQAQVERMVHRGAPTAQPVRSHP